MVLDWGSLTLSALVADSGDDLGPIVCRLLAEPDALVDHVAFPVDRPPGVEPVALVLFCWLHHLLPELTAAAEHGVGRYWVSRNVQPVMSALAQQAATTT